MPSIFKFSKFMKFFKFVEFVEFVKFFGDGVADAFDFHAPRLDLTTKYRSDALAS